LPRFHFNVEDGQSWPDREGTELPDVGAARSEAVHLAGRLLQDGAAEFWDSGQWRVVVTDGAGVPLFTLSFTASEQPRAAPVRNG